MSDLDTLPLRDAGASASTEVGCEQWIGRVIAGRYVVEGVLGRGGMGYVFEARHVSLGVRVAVKVLRAEIARNGEAVARFHREAKSAASIGHPGIVKVIDFGYSEEGGAYIVMERLEGSDLRALLHREGPLSVERTLAVARAVAEALGAAHARGIVHRDLKSGNVFLTHDKRVKVLDFGVSKMLDADGDAPSTQHGALVGTPHYMAPEQGTDGRTVDHRADLYALGCILFEALTGVLPFEGTTAVEVLYKHVHEAPRRPSSLRPGVPPLLDRLVLRLLAKDRAARPPDAQAVLDALAKIEVAGVHRGRVARLGLAAMGVVATALMVRVAWLRRTVVEHPTNLRLLQDSGDGIRDTPAVEVGAFDVAMVTVPDVVMLDAAVVLDAVTARVQTPVVVRTPRAQRNRDAGARIDVRFDVASRMTVPPDGLRPSPYRTDGGR